MKVFLSSTGRDLTAYRDAAFDAIQGMGHHCVRMEDFHGPAVKIEDFDSQRVAECELFVILIGHLHGNCPQGSDKSYTELEYDVAQKAPERCYLFFTHEDFPLSLREPDAKFDLQQAFRQRASKGIIRNIFTSPEDLKAQVAMALPKPNEAVTGESFLPTPPQPYFVHPYPLQENFTGRRSERRMLTEWLAGNRPVLSLSAIGGMGKSSLTWVWLQNDVLGEPPPRVPEGIFWWSFYERDATFAAFVREALRYASKGRARHDSTYDQLRALEAIMAQKRFLLVLDGFERELRPYAGLNAAYQGDQVDETDRRSIDPHAGGFLRFAASQGATRVLLTTRLDPEELDGLAGCQHESLTSMDPEDAVHFFQAQGVTGNRAEIQAACAPYGYHPLALRLLAGLIVKDHRQPGDIRVADRYPVTEKLKGQAKHHILQVAYDAMEKPARELLGSLAAFRSPMTYDSLLTLNPFGTEDKFDVAIDELITRGLLFFDRTLARYDLHPVVRQYAYDRLTDKASVHTRLRDYFAAVTTYKKVESLEKLLPVIELFHHTLRTGQYDEALKLYQDRLDDALYFRLGGYQLCIDLLRGLFPEGEEQPPQLERADSQTWTQGALAGAYSRSGQPRRAVALYVLRSTYREQADEKFSFTFSLSNLGSYQLSLGRLREADQNFRRSIAASHVVRSAPLEAMRHQELGRLEAYQGRPSESARELDTALAADRGDKQGEGLTRSYLAILALLTGTPQEAFKHAYAAHQLAAVGADEPDIIQAEWLLGWSLIQQSPAESEAHLTAALTRCRRINLIELEPDILIAFARWHRAGNNAAQALAHVREALALADRCEYRLVQADCHNLQAQVALDAGDRATAFAEASIAKERAYCDGPPHYYKSAYDEAESILKSSTANEPPNAISS